MNRIRQFLLACAALALASSALAAGEPVGIKVTDGVLTNTAGMTLYTFDKDAAGSGKSACNGPCATNWPPFGRTADAKAAGD